jgi:hypothetical protein
MLNRKFNCAHCSRYSQKKYSMDVLGECIIFSQTIAKIVGSPQLTMNAMSTRFQLELVPYPPPPSHHIGASLTKYYQAMLTPFTLVLALAQDSSGVYVVLRNSSPTNTYPPQFSPPPQSPTYA